MQDIIADCIPFCGIWQNMRDVWRETARNSLLQQIHRDGDCEEPFPFGFRRHFLQTKKNGAVFRAWDAPRFNSHQSLSGND